MNISADKLFAVLAHPLRLRCLLLLLEHGELCVCELTAATGAAQPSVSRHLGQLRAAGVVSDRREGLWIHYRLHPGLPAWALAVLQHAALGQRDTEPYRSDRARLAAMPQGIDRRSCG